ncbi:MAG: diaminopimelate epimerase [Promethearchaeia archaeon]
MELKNLNFEKYHGLGNDYIIINNIIYNIPDDKKGDLARILCQRHFSVGADGLIFVCKPFQNHIRMRIFNADGTEAEMCGNGIRCFAKYVYEKGLVDSKNIKVHTLKGTILTEVNVEDSIVKSVKVNMGSPILECEKIPVITEGLEKYCINETIVAIDKIFKFTAVSMGNPHAIIFVNDLPNDDQLNMYGAFIESNPIFPKKTNVEFVKVISPTEARMRVFERGVGITKACGTGTCAAVVAGVLLEKFEKNVPIKIHNDGGDLTIIFNGKDVIMEGPVVKVFSGIINHISL